MWVLEVVKDKVMKIFFDGKLLVSECIVNICIDFGLICCFLGQLVVLVLFFILMVVQMDEMFQKLEVVLDKVFVEVV